MTAALRRLLGVHEGELRPLLVLFAQLFLTTAATVALSSAKNGLFLSVYEADLIPHVIIASALLAAGVSLLFTGVLAGVPRRRVIDILGAGFAVSLVVSEAAYAAAPRTSFAIYLWLSVVQVLTVSQAWAYAGDLLTGREGRRLLPLIAAGGSLAGIVAGFGLAPAVLAFGTPNLLLLAAFLLIAPLPLLRLLPEPPAPPSPGSHGPRRFLRSTAAGFRGIGRQPLLLLLAVTVVLTSLISTLVDYQFKVELQRAFTRDRITAVYGILEGAVGVGSLLVQFVAARWIFRRFSISAAATAQAGLLASLALGFAAVGTLWILALLRTLDDVLRFSIQRPVEQVSYTPFPPRIKHPAYATISGVLRPLAKAAGGAMVLVLAAWLHVVPWLILAGALAALGAYLRHRRLYLAALEEALARHSVDLGSGATLVVDRTALGVLDRALSDDDVTVVVFATSLLRRLPASEARPRARALLEHPADEVRAEAAAALGDVEAAAGPGAEPEPLLERLEREGSPIVLASILAGLGQVEKDGLPREGIVRMLEHPAATVRGEALVTLGRWETRNGGAEWRARVGRLLRSDDAADRGMALRAIGELGETAFLRAVARHVGDPATRAAALDALARLGVAALPAIEELLADRGLELPARRALVTTLAGIDAPPARERLLALLGHPDLGPAALTSLRRLRRAGRAPAAEPERITSLLQVEAGEALRHELSADALGRLSRDPRVEFAARELRELRKKGEYRCLALLSLVYDPERLASVEANVLSDERGRRSHALELLEGIIEPEHAAVIMPLMELAPGITSADDLVVLVPDGEEILHHPLEALRREAGWWPLALGLFARAAPAQSRRTSLERLSRPPEPERIEDFTEEEREMIPLIEKVMLLKGCALFKSLPGEELTGVAQLAEPVHIEGGEVLFREGEPGDAFYVVAQGAIRIDKGGQELAVLRSREGFGEIALLDRGSRSASATAAEPTTLLRLDRDSFDELVERNPAIARGIYRVLMQRLRSTLAQVAAG